jgi:CheY-like chemotaxis protein
VAVAVYTARETWVEHAHREVTILLVEDNPGDVRLTVEALREGRIVNSLRVVNDGDAAMDFVHKRGEYRDAPRPDLILLDLNLPRKDGREVLEELKGDPDLHRIPVIVLTTSSSEADVLRSYDLHANCYISKPIGYDDFMAAVRSMENFWLKVVTLPPR